MGEEACYTLHMAAIKSLLLYGLGMINHLAGGPPATLCSIHKSHPITLDTESYIVTS